MTTSWKSDVSSAIQLLAQDIKNLRAAISSGHEGHEFSSFITTHVDKLTESISDLEEVEFSDVVKAAQELKKHSILVVESIGDSERLLERLSEFANFVRKLNEANKAAPELRGKSSKRLLS